MCLHTTLECALLTSCTVHDPHNSIFRQSSGCWGGCWGLVKIWRHSESDDLIVMVGSKIMLLPLLAFALLFFSLWWGVRDNRSFGHLQWTLNIGVRFSRIKQVVVAQLWGLLHHFTQS